MKLYPDLLQRQGEEGEDAKFTKQQARFGTHRPLDVPFVPTRDVSLLAQRHGWRSNSVLFVHNLGPQPREEFQSPSKCRETRV
jgi:hypothetical protein